MILIWRPIALVIFKVCVCVCGGGGSGPPVPSLGPPMMSDLSLCLICLHEYWELCTVSCCQYTISSNVNWKQKLVMIYTYNGYSFFVAKIIY